MGSDAGHKEPSWRGAGGRSLNGVAVDKIARTGPSTASQFHEWILSQELGWTSEDFKKARKTK
jgi:hypothetical protein